MCRRPERLMGGEREGETKAGAEGRELQDGEGYVSGLTLHDCLVTGKCGKVSAADCSKTL